MTISQPPSTCSARALDLSRRQALGVTLAAIAAPYIHAQDKSGLATPIVGAGEHTYQCFHDWARLPSLIAFGNTHGVAVDAAGCVHIKHTVHATSQSGDAICVFDPDGQFIRSWGSAYRSGAHGLTLSGEGPAGRDEFLYLSDCQRGVVQKTTLTGEVAIDVPWPEESGVYGSKTEYKPTNIAVVPPAPAGASDAWQAHAGTFYVADGYGKSWIHQYSPTGTYVRTFGGPGAERGQVSCPHGIAIDTRGADPTIVVADRSNHRLQYFSLDGRHRGFVKNAMRSPCHFHFRGDLMLVPDLEAIVTLLGKDNKPIIQLGDGTNFALRDKPREQFIPGKFIAPHSACFDHAGNIFVVEWVEVGRVTLLKPVSA